VEHKNAQQSFLLRAYSLNFTENRSTAMSERNDEELEFIAVGADEDNELNTYMDPNVEAQNSAIGGWIFTQSKVR
jgi:hypothetical protein